MADNSLSASAVGKVVNVTGSAVAHSNGSLRQLEPGSDIFKGETLVTKDASTLEIVFKDDTSLTQGANSEIRVDNYVYDPADASSSDLLLNLSKGVFRTITGEIADKNPDHFKLKSPLATIGIRGTTVVSEVRDGQERHGVEEIGPGKTVVFMDAMENIELIQEAGLMLDLSEGTSMTAPRDMTREEKEFFESAAPSSREVESEGEGDEDENAREEAEAEDQQAGEEGVPEEELSTEDAQADIQPEAVVMVEPMVSFSDMPDLFAMPAEFDASQTPIDSSVISGDTETSVEESDNTSNDLTIFGTSGDDILEGGDGNDTILGLGGDDWLFGNAGDDILDGGSGSDRLIGGAGNDTLIGGEEPSEYPGNEAVYKDDPGPVTVNILYTYSGGVGSYAGSKVTDGWGGTDTLDNISGIIGSAYDDTISIKADLTGSYDDIHWYASGMEGSDTIIGPPNSSYEEVGAMYIEDPSGVYVDLEAGFANDGWGDTDTLADIRVTGGSQYDDVLYGTNDSAGDVFVLTLGDDTINGRGSDMDEIDYEYLDSLGKFAYGEVDLAGGNAEGYDSSGNLLFYDTLSNIEDVLGSQGDDTIFGSTADNWISGEEGDDILTGGSDGIDTIEGGDGDDSFRLVDEYNSDRILDFQIHQNRGNDIIQFDETQFTFNVNGTSKFTLGAASDNLDPHTYRVIGVEETALSWSNPDVTAAIDSVLDTTQMDNSADDTYFIVSNGTDAKVYYWEGDVTDDNSVSGELYELAELESIGDLSDLDASNVDIITV